jgi:hypothetical protein
MTVHWSVFSGVEAWHKEMKTGKNRDARTGDQENGGHVVSILKARLLWAETCAPQALHGKQLRP